ncbi:MAG: amino acid--tRNA ligase-related protein [Planctomycetota bacterium]
MSYELKTQPGPQVKHEAPLTLGIQRIEPVNLNDPSVLAALEQTRRALRNPKLKTILEVRTSIQKFLSDALVEAGYVHPPIYMLAGCTDPLNHWTYPARLNYYGEEVSVSQSLILQKILMVMLSPVDQVFWASPNIRMEMRISRKEYKYASEFMQVDFEKRGGTYDEMLGFISGLVSGLYRYLREHHGRVIEEFRGEALPDVGEAIKIHDSQEIRREQGLADDDAVERWLSKQAGGKPFLVVNLKREAYDCYDMEAGRFLNYDVVLPPAGENPYPVECLFGAERTRTLDSLAERMRELNYPMAYFAPFFELFSSLDQSGGAISCAGAGFGVERLTYAILGLKDVHDVYPFPRMAEGRIAF